MPVKQRVGFIYPCSLFDVDVFCQPAKPLKNPSLFKIRHFLKSGREFAFYIGEPIRQEEYFLPKKNIAGLYGKRARSQRKQTWHYQRAINFLPAPG